MVDHEIVADYRELESLTHSTVREYLGQAKFHIDQEFGEGFAKKNPALVAEMVRAQTADFNTAILKLAAQDVRDGLQAVLQ